MGGAYVSRQFFFGSLAFPSTTNVMTIFQSISLVEEGSEE